jgi:hypothetical protein
MLETFAPSSALVSPALERWHGFCLSIGRSHKYGDRVSSSVDIVIVTGFGWDETARATAAVYGERSADLWKRLHALLSVYRR